MTRGYFDTVVQDLYSSSVRVNHAAWSVQELSALEDASSKLALSLADAAEVRRLGQEADIMNSLNAKQQDAVLAGLQSELIR